MYDFIGDIHGYGDHLETLLKNLGYKYKNGVYQHPTRKAFFLGDLIDKGPKVKKVIEIVQPMVLEGQAKCIMANHEFNYICYFTEGKDGNPLREHTQGNARQNKETVKAFSKSENDALIEWFLTLPMWFEASDFRTVHACWDQHSIKCIEEIQGGNLIDINILKERYHKGDIYFDYIDHVLKGIEIKLPEGVSFSDKYDKKRTKARLTWWDLDQVTTETSVRGDITKKMVKEIFTPPTDSKIIFFGHYWLQGRPYITNPTAQCLDFSIADSDISKNLRNLVAYRFQGEKSINPDHFCYINYDFSFQSTK